MPIPTRAGKLEIVVGQLSRLDTFRLKLYKRWSVGQPFVHLLHQTLHHAYGNGSAAIAPVVDQRKAGRVCSLALNNSLQ